jgi:hypothetical protein
MVAQSTLLTYRQTVDAVRHVPAYREPRARPRGYAVATVVKYLLLSAFSMAGVIAGLVATMPLPRSTGSVRVPIVFLVAVAGGLAGWWLPAAAGGTVLGCVRWSAASLAAHERLPAMPYFRHSQRPDLREPVLTLALVLAVPALITWGPVVGTLTLVHGVADQRLVSTLRQHGVPATGYVINVPSKPFRVVPDTGSPYMDVSYSTGLAFKARGGRTVVAPAPDIGGTPYVLPRR